MVQAGQYVTDGTAVFLVTDIRDGAQVGDIKMSPILRDGYVKANGALLTSASTNYPRLVQFVTDNPSLKAVDDTAWASNKALYVYDDTNDTLRIPDATGRVLQGGADVKSIEAGVPNITGSFLIRGLNNVAHGLLDSTTASFSSKQEAFYTIQANSPNGNALRVSMNASRSNSIYGSSPTVQPPALTMIPQIRY